MIHEANKHQWEIGDLVLHDADHKSVEMLMQVIGFTSDGKVNTRYIDNRYHGSSYNKKSEETMREVWTNPMECLHDPLRFISGDEMYKVMPEEIWAYRDSSVENGWDTEQLDNGATKFIREDVALSRTHKVCVIQFNIKEDYWEMLSDGSLFFRGYDKDAEVEEDDDSAAWSQFSAGTWQPIAGDIGLEENIRDLKDEGYQVIFIPKPQSDVQTVRKFIEDVDIRLDIVIINKDGILFDASEFIHILKETLQEWKSNEDVISNNETE